MALTEIPHAMARVLMSLLPSFTAGAKLSQIHA
jgi:hypothetical protein